MVSIGARLVKEFLALGLLGKPVMIVIEYMENGALDAFLRVSTQNTYPKNQDG